MLLKQLGESDAMYKKSLAEEEDEGALSCKSLIPILTLLIVDLSPSQSLLLWFAEHLESLCSL